MPGTLRLEAAHAMNISFTQLCTRYTLKNINGGWGPCPFCAQATRHRKSRDRRGAIWVSGDAWKCLQCERGGSGGISQQEKALLPRADVSPPSRNIEKLWKCPVMDDSPVRDLCALRKFSYEGVRERGLAKSLQPQCPFWYKNGYQVLLPLYDHFGYIRSLTSRHKDLVPSHDRPKSLFFPKISTSGLALMPSFFAYGLRKQHHFFEISTVIFVEGIADYLALASIAPVPCVVIGIIAGTFTKDFVSSFGDYQIAAALHEDEAGERYYQQLHRYSANGIKKISIRSYNNNFVHDPLERTHHE